MTNWNSTPLQCAAIRVTRLGSDGGTPADAGPGMSYASSGLMKIEFNPDVEAGPEVSQRGASGNLDQVFKMKDLIKRYTFTIQMSWVDPELEWLLTGGSLLTSSASPLTTMGTLSSSTASSGGTMVAGTFGYKVAALSTYGETLPSAEKTQVIASGTTNTVTLTWTKITGAVGYRVYGRTSGGPWKALTQIPQADSPTWTDTGAITPDPLMVPATVDTSGISVNGLAYPSVGVDPNPFGVSIEAWQRNIAQRATPGYPAGQQIGQAPWVRWVFPSVQGLRKANRSIDGNPADSSFEGGFAVENSQWGNGPFNDWLYPSDRAVQMAYDTDDHVPTTQVGRIQIPTQV